MQGGGARRCAARRDVRARRRVAHRDLGPGPGHVRYLRWLLSVAEPQAVRARAARRVSDHGQVASCPAPVVVVSAANATAVSSTVWPNRSVTRSAYGPAPSPGSAMK